MKKEEYTELLRENNVWLDKKLKEQKELYKKELEKMIDKLKTIKLYNLKGELITEKVIEELKSLEDGE